MSTAFCMNPRLSPDKTRKPTKNTLRASFAARLVGLAKPSFGIIKKIYRDYYNINMITELSFPNDATIEERQTDWRLIAEISDGDFGFNNLKSKDNRTRFSVRCILRNNNGDICVIK